MDQVRIVLYKVSEHVHDIHIPLGELDFFDALPLIVKRNFVVLVFEDLAEGESQACQRPILADGFHEGAPVARQDYVPTEIYFSQVLRLLDVLGD